VWNKVLAGNFLNAKITPLMTHEDITIFGQGRITYNPQMTKGKLRGKGRKTVNNGDGSMAYGAFNPVSAMNDWYYPDSILAFSNGDRNNNDHGLHPTQKPVSLFSYLIRTFSNPDETVLDNCIGSGTTAVACIENGRHFIGIEKRKDYCDIARERVAKAQLQPRLPLVIEPKAVQESLL
jgi:site-specific DNA-methyltransferase (adenine-specific)